MKARLKTAALAAALAIGGATASLAATIPFDLVEGETLSFINETIPTTGEYSITITSGTGAFSFFSSEFTYAAGVTTGSYVSANLTAGLLFTSFLSSASATMTGFITTPDSGLSAVPLPATLPLLAGALGVAGFASRRRKKAA